VSVPMEVTDMRRGRRHQMVTAERVIQDEGKRRQDRQGGRDASAPR